MEIFLILLGPILFFSPFVIFGIINAKKKNEWGDKLNEIDKTLNSQEFTTSKVFRHKGNEFEVAIDATQRKFCYIEAKTAKKTFYSYDDVISVEIVKDGVIVSTKSTTSTIGRAAVGGLLAGGVGAVIGGSTAKTTTTNEVHKIVVKVHLRNIECPTLNMVIFDGIMEEDAELMDEARSLMDIFVVIVDDVNRKHIEEEHNRVLNQVNVQKENVADELLKYASLKEKGIISEQEFETLKAKLLS